MTENRKSQACPVPRYGIENPPIMWQHVIGQDRVKHILNAAYCSNTLGHAYLFSGEEGVGKFQAAVEFAMGLLCTDENHHPCYRCGSCRKILCYSHPDFRILMPVSLEKTYKKSDGTLNAAGWEYLGEQAQSRLDAPYIIPERTGVPQIPVEWVKETNHAILRGCIEGAFSITIIEGIDAMNKESANAMLKTLEEPPPQTLFLLLTSKPYAVLPTIISRCRLVRFGFLSHDHLREGISRHAHDSESDNKNVDDALLQLSMGSLGKALTLCRHETADAASRAHQLWKACCSGDWERIFSYIDNSYRADFGEQEQLYLHLLSGIRGDLFSDVTGPNASEPDFTLQKNRITPERAHRLTAMCDNAVYAARLNINPATVLTNTVFSMMEILHE